MTRAPAENYLRRQEGNYRIALTPPLTHCNTGLPKQVRFVARHDLPLPSPRYLHIHAACCRIAYLSGARRYLDKVLDNVDNLKTLAEDGSSADILAYALYGLRLSGPE